jgi:hypothetical protein
MTRQLLGLVSPALSFSKVTYVSRSMANISMSSKKLQVKRFPLLLFRRKLQLIALKVMLDI